MTAQQPATPVRRGLAIFLTLPTTITEYLNVLCGKGYLKGGDAIKLMTAPSASYTATVTTVNGIDTLSAGAGNPALKVWMNQDVDPATTVFCASHNYVYDTALAVAAVPYGTKGFITIRKGGDASVFRVGQATDTGWTNGTVFQTSVGSKVGDPSWNSECWRSYCPRRRRADPSLTYL